MQNFNIFLSTLFLQVKIKLLAKASDLSRTDLDMTGFEFMEHELEEEENCTMVIASNIVEHKELLQIAASSLAEGGCILAREKVDTKNVLSSGFRLNVVFEKTLKDEKLLLLRKVVVQIGCCLREWHSDTCPPLLSKTGDTCPFHYHTSVYGLTVGTIKAAGLDRSYIIYFNKNVDKC